MEPNVEDAAVTPTDVPLSYPCFSIAGIEDLTNTSGISLGRTGDTSEDHGYKYV